MLIFSGDWHIRHDNKIWASRPNITGDLEAAIDQICEIIKTKCPSAFFLAGDTFDRPFITSYSIALFQKFVLCCKNVGTRIYFVLGQHDRGRPPLPATINSYCQYINGKCINIRDLKIYGMDILRYAGNKNSISLDCDILVTHQVWKEFIPFNSTLSIADVQGAGCVISGDWHDLVILDTEPKLISPGSIVPQALSEVAPKGLIVIDEDSLEISRIRIKSRKIVHIIIKSIDEIEDANKTIESAINESSMYPEPINVPIIVVKYKHGLDIRELISSSAGSAIIIYSQFVDTPPTYESNLKDSTTFKNKSIEDAIISLDRGKFETKLAIACWRDGLRPLEKFFESGEFSSED